MEKKAVIINLTRFGDLIQSQPVLTKLKARDFSTHLVCLENFASAAHLLSDVDQVHPFPGARFLALLDTSWTRAVAELQDWVAGTTNGLQFDLAVNLTASLSSRLLTRMYQARENRGFFLDKMGFGCYSGNWPAFLQASSAHRGSSPFNIVDLFVRAAHLDQGRTELSVISPGQDQMNTMRQLLNRESGGRQFSGYITFQLGASDDKRRWPVENFVALGDLLNKELNICPVLLGSKNEQYLADKYHSLSGSPPINLCGRTDLEQLSAALVCSKLLITNDTGTMHLAAGLGVKSLSFFLATAQPWDTGPYLEDCLCMEPGMKCHPCSFDHHCQSGFACRKIITPEVVFQAAKDFINTQTWPELETSLARVRRTTFRDGFYFLKPVNHAAEDNYSLWMQIQHHFYRLFLEEKNISPPRDIPRPDSMYCREIAEHIRSINPLLNLAGEQAGVLCKVTVPKVKKNFLNTWQRLSQLLSQSPYFPVLGLLWTYQTQVASTELDKIILLCRKYSSLLESMDEFLKG
ncbi:MAG: glycosyltransferase family 9 protein [Desulfonatronovibrio sp.]